MGAMPRPYNFSPGPAALPEPVLRQAASEMLDWNGSGLSVMEVSHRGKEFMALQAGIEADLRELLAIPENYKVLFLQGGAIGQNAIVPMNLLRGRTRADYVDTGAWATRSIAEAKRYCEVNVAASGAASGFTAIPKQAEWRLDPGAAYVHICANETIGGVEYHWVPDTGDVPLVADFSSSIASEPVDVSKYGVIYAGAQKNLGPVGITVVIVRRDLLERAGQNRADIFNYASHLKGESMLNTPPTWNWYMLGLNVKWMLAEGGVAEFARRNAEKAALLYSVIDGSGGYYRNEVAAAVRSRMNVPFFLHDEALDKPFLSEAKAAGLIALKGHRALGGMRASIYNAMPVEGVKALAGFMQDFQQRHG
jgi:phosphoserine aminotransferase